MTAVDDEVHEVGDPSEFEPVDEAASETVGVKSPSWTWWTRERLFSLIVVAACCIYMVWAVHPELVLTDTTATGGDMGAHVWGPAFMRDFLLPQFAVTGWSADWYAGFPAYLFYMVIPSLIIVILDVGIFDVTSIFGALASVVVVAGAIAAMWRIRHHESRLVRFVVWVGAGLGALLLIDLPYNIAFKLVVVSGLIAFPAAVWYLMNALSLRRPGPELGAIASLLFLMDRYLFNIYGGNMASTMAGEFAFSISITLALFGLGLVANGVRTGRYRARAAMVIALSLMCHVIPGFFFLVTAAVIIVVLRPQVSSWKWALPTGLSAGLMGLWWYLPFYGHSHFLNDMGWEKLGVQLRGESWARTQIGGALRTAGVEVASSNPVDAIRFDMNWVQIRRYLLPFAPFEINGQTINDPNMHHGKIIFALAVVGAVMSLIMVVRAGIFFTLVTAITAIAFIVMPQHRFWNARVLPFYYLSIFLLAAIGVALLIRAGALVFKGRWVDPPAPISMGVTLASFIIVFVAMGMPLRALPGGSMGADGAYHWLWLSAKADNPVRGWAQWNFDGLERKPGTRIETENEGTDQAVTRRILDTSNSDEFFGMIDMMDEVGSEHGCGRAMWEYGERLGDYGTPMAPMLLPYFTDHCIGSMEGLYFEASSTTPFHFLVQSEMSEKPSRPQRFDSHLQFASSPYLSLDVAAGVSHLQLMGVKYYLALTDAAKEMADAEPRLTKVGESGPWRAYEVADIDLVTPLENEPVVWNDVPNDIYDYAKPAIDWFNDESQWEVVLATSGPKEWKRISAGETAPVTPTDAKSVKVTNVKSTQDTISFDVSETGVPVLIRSSYFPNWRVDGADDVYRVTPNQMVVVPTSNHVELSYGRSGIEWIGYLLSLIGFIGFLYFVIRGPGLAVTPETGEFFGDREFIPEDDDGEGEDGVSEDGPAEGSGLAGDSDPPEEDAGVVAEADVGPPEDPLLS